MKTNVSKNKAQTQKQDKPLTKVDARILFGTDGGSAGKSNAKIQANERAEPLA